MRTDCEILDTFSLMNQLRPHLLIDEYVEKIKQLQNKYDYTLAAVIENGEVKCVIGYRMMESLAWNKCFYVDDLITDPNSRSSGYAKLLFDWLEREAVLAGCQQIHLDSGVHRFDAHRFYLNRKMNITCHHFQRNL
nr:GNAT family N-acetyltransferase [Paenibacillus castaneae]